MIWPEPRTPSGEDAGDLAPHGLPALKFHAVALAIVEANGLDAAVAVERVARQTVESCPPENNTNAAPSSFMPKSENHVVAKPYGRLAF